MVLRTSSINASLFLQCFSAINHCLIVVLRHCTAVEAKSIERYDMFSHAAVKVVAPGVILTICWTHFLRYLSHLP